MPKAGDVIVIKARVLAVNEDANLVIVERIKPPTAKGSTSNGESGDGGYAVMWGT